MKSLLLTGMLALLLAPGGRGWAAPEATAELPKWAMPRKATPEQVFVPVTAGPNHFQKYARTIRFTVSGPNGQRDWKESRSIVYTAVSGEDCAMAEHLTRQDVDPTGRLHVIDSVERWFFRGGRLYAHVYNGSCVMDPAGDVTRPSYLPVLDFPLGLRLVKEGGMVTQAPSDRVTLAAAMPEGTTFEDIASGALAEGSFLTTTTAGKDRTGGAGTAVQRSLWQPIGPGGPPFAMATWQERTSRTHGVVRMPAQLTSILRSHGDTPAHVEMVFFSFPGNADYSQEEIDTMVRERDPRVVSRIESYRLLESRPALDSDTLRLAQVTDEIVYVVPRGAAKEDAGTHVWDAGEDGRPAKYHLRYNDESMEWEPVR